MADAKNAWDEVGKNFVELGSTLRTHFSPPGTTSSGQAGREDAMRTAPSDAGAEAGEAGRGSAGVTQEMRDALQQLGVALEGAFEAVGRAAKDPAVTAEVRTVGQSLANALASTFSEVGDELKKAFTRGAARPGSSTSSSGDADTGPGTPGD